jgi:hypothetical protein
MLMDICKCVHIFGFCRTSDFRARFQVLTMMLRKIEVFWDMTPCLFVNRYPRFGGACCLHLLGTWTSWILRMGGSKLHNM